MHIRALRPTDVRIMLHITYAAHYYLHSPASIFFGFAYSCFFFVQNGLSFFFRPLHAPNYANARTSTSNRGLPRLYNSSTIAECQIFESRMELIEELIFESELGFRMFAHSYLRVPNQFFFFFYLVFPVKSQFLIVARSPVKAVLRVADQAVSYQYYQQTMFLLYKFFYPSHMANLSMNKDLFHLTNRLS